MRPEHLFRRLSARVRLVLLAFVLSPICSFAQTTEFRGLWVDAWGAGFFSSNEVAKLVTDCHNYNFNALVVQMRRRGDAFYMPQAPNLEPRTTALTANYDALAELIRQCHNATPRIEVHCWVTSFLIWSSTTPPSQASHVVNLHPEYLMENSSGAQYISEGYYLDPGNPDATLWNYNMAKDVVSNYDVDGFHWDYIRYPTTDSGYNPVAIARYNAEFGLSGKPSSSDAQFSTWRRRQVTDFLRWVNSDLLAVKPNLVVSCSVFGDRSDAYNARYQDWATWNNEGIIDVCMPMGYTSSLSTFQSRANDAYANQGIRRVYEGVGAYLNTPSGTVSQLNYARSKGLLGTMFYSYRTPNGPQPTYPIDQPGTFTYVRNNYQPTWVNTPTIPWKATPTKGILRGTVARADNAGGIYNATVTLTGASSRTQLTEAHGKFGFFDTVPGNYTVTVTTIGLGTLTTNVSLVAGENKEVFFRVPVDDHAAPVISGVAVTNITDSSAVIVWRTDETSDSKVDFGTSVSYGSSISNSILSVGHSLTLSNLEPNTTYNFRVRSTDASGNTATSGNFTFSTLLRGNVTDIIIDNQAATFAGTWTTGSSSTDKYGPDYRYASSGSPGTKTADFVPTILTAGTYDVYEWHPQGGNRTTAASHKIVYSGGQQTLTIDQTTNGGKWNLLGRYTFAAGTTGKVTIDNNFSTGSVVLADAIKFVYVPPPPTAPTLLSVSAVTATQLNVTWRDTSSNEMNFIIGRSTNAAGPFADVGSTDANVTNFADLNLTPATRYYYVARATNVGGASSNSASASGLTFDGPPIIVRQPQGQTVAEGGTISMDVLVRANSPRYQWQLNSVDIPAATNSSLVINNASAANEGDYIVTITSTGGSTVSDTAVVQVNYLLNIFATNGSVIKSPDQNAYSYGDNVTLTAVPALNYAFVGWTGDADGTNDTVVVSMNRSKTVVAHFRPESDLIVDNPQATLVGQWILGTASTDKYGSSYLYAGTVAGTPTVQAYFTPMITYAGKYNVFMWSPGGSTRTTNAAASIVFSGGTTNISVDQTPMDGGWRLLARGKDFVEGTSGYVRLANNSGETNKLLIADAVRFALVLPPAFIQQPQNQTVKPGESAKFVALATGTGLSYQWLFNGATIAGAKGAIYTIPVARLRDAGSYSVVVSNEVTSITSSPAVLSVVPSPFQLGNFALTLDRRVQFQLSGDPADYIVESSSNLLNWTTVTNITLSTGSAYLIDPAATNLPLRFYRSRLAP